MPGGSGSAGDAGTVAVHESVMAGHPFFRWLDADRTPADRSATVVEFYRRLELALSEHPDAAAVWHVMSLRIARRARRAS